jgi:hypothetical protein
MIYGCVTSSRYTMTAKVYLQQTSQDFDTGEFVRSYSSPRTVKCYASGIVASGKDVPGVFEMFSRKGEYSSTDFVRIITVSPLDKQAIVSFITSSNGIMWTEDSGVPTVFDANGSVPVVDASGRVVEYVTMLTRSEVQDAQNLG